MLNLLVMEFLHYSVLINVGENSDDQMHAFMIEIIISSVLVFSKY